MPVSVHCGKANCFDQSKPDLIDHQWLKLIACNQIIYGKYNITGEILSICSAYTMNLKTH
jgi:hypothetical protein